MATAPKPPIPVGALTLLGGSMPDMSEDPRVDSILSTLTDNLTNKDNAWKDEQLAFAGGMRDPSGNGSFGGALSAGFKAQSEERSKSKELQAQYLPQILNTVISQQTAKQANAMLQGLMGPQGGSYLQTVSQKYGLAPEFITTDLMTNGGKGVAEKIYKNSTPEYVNQDGALIDKNPYTNGMYQGGAQGGSGGGNGRTMPAFSWTPGIQQSASGNAMLRMPDPSAPGGIRVGAPAGGAESSKMYANIGEEVKANWDPQTVTPRGENPQMTTRGDLVRRTQGGPQTPQAPAAPVQTGPQIDPRNPAQVRGAFEGNPQDIAAQIAAIPDPAAREQAMQAYEAQMRGRNPPFRQVPENGAEAPGNSMPVNQGNLQQQLRAAQAARDPVRVAQIQQKISQATGNPPSVGMELESPAEAKRAVEAVDTEQKNLSSNLSEMKKAKTAVDMYDKAIKSLEEGKATSSGIGAVRDSVGNFFGVPTDASVAAEELRTIGKWLTSNVPRMEGPQSNFDVANYEQMTGMVANEKLPIASRLAAAKVAKQLIMDAAPKEFGAGWTQSQSVNTPSGGPSLADLARQERARRSKKE